MNKIIILLFFIFLYLYSYSIDNYKLTNLRVKPNNCEWSDVIPPCDLCDSIIIMSLDKDECEIIINTKTKQKFNYIDFKFKYYDNYVLMYDDAIDYFDRRVRIAIYVYDIDKRYLHIKYSDGEYLYEIVK